MPVGRAMPVRGCQREDPLPGNLPNGQAPTLPKGGRVKLPERTEGGFFPSPIGRGGRGVSAAPIRWRRSVGVPFGQH